MEQTAEDLEFVRRQKLTALTTRLNRVLRSIEETISDIPAVPENDAVHAVRKDLALQWLRGARENIGAANNQMSILRDGPKAVARRQNSI